MKECLCVSSGDLEVDLLCGDAGLVVELDGGQRPGVLTNVLRFPQGMALQKLTDSSRRADGAVDRGNWKPDEEPKSSTLPVRRRHPQTQLGTVRLRTARPFFDHEICQPRLVNLSLGWVIDTPDPSSHSI